MINSFQDFQKVSKVETTDYMQSMGELNKSWQAIATEMTDYSKRSFENNVATFQKLASAMSVPEASRFRCDNYYVRASAKRFLRECSGC